jgi:transposase
MSQRSTKRTAVKKVARGKGSASPIHVGLDVHKLSVHVALWQNGRITRTWVQPRDSDLLISALHRLGAPIALVVYEAGPTGYALAYDLKEAGLPVRVIAPNKTPRVDFRDPKSDRLDCRRAAEFAALGMLTYVAVPTPDQLALRQIVRLRDQLVNKVRRTKQQIRSLLLFHNITEPERLKNWSRAAVDEFRTMQMPEHLDFTRMSLLSQLDHLQAELSSVEKHIDGLARSRALAPRVALLRTHPGVGPVLATSFLAEFYQPERFSTGRQVARYLGLAPGVRQSGETRRGGRLLKSGLTRLRSLLVEASWSWVSKDQDARAVYGRLVHNTASGKKAIVGVARRLAIHLWTMLTRGEAYLAPDALVSRRSIQT